MLKFIALWLWGPAGMWSWGHATPPGGRLRQQLCVHLRRCGRLPLARPAWRWGRWVNCRPCPTRKQGSCEISRLRQDEDVCGESLDWSEEGQSWGRQGWEGRGDGCWEREGAGRMGCAGCSEEMPMFQKEDTDSGSLLFLVCKNSNEVLLALRFQHLSPSCGILVSWWSVKKRSCTPHIRCPPWDSSGDERTMTGGRSVERQGSPSATCSVLVVESLKWCSSWTSVWTRSALAPEDSGSWTSWSDGRIESLPWTCPRRCTSWGGRLCRRCGSSCWWRIARCSYTELWSWCCCRIARKMTETKTSTIRTLLRIKS